MSTYADTAQRIIGAEYMYKMWGRISALQPINAFAYGDSTIFGVSIDSPYCVQNILPRMAKQAGLPVPLSVTNRGVSGTKITDMNALPDLASAPDLFIIKYGINDGALDPSTRLATFQNGLNSQLASIRSAQNGALSQLAIVLMGPNSTNDASTGRTAAWYEQLQPVYEAAARQYQCMYFDTYALWQDSVPAATLWMDNLLGNGSAIHPLDMMATWIWAYLAEAIFGHGQCLPWATQPLALQSGWLAYGGQWAVPTASLMPGGDVQVTGLIKGGATAPGTLITQLPAAFAPPFDQLFVCASNSGPVTIHVAANGQVVAHTGIDGTYTSLDGVKFKAA